MRTLARALCSLSLGLPVACNGNTMARPEVPDGGARKLDAAGGDDPDAQSLTRVEAGGPRQSDAAAQGEASRKDARRSLGHGRSTGCGLAQTGTNTFEARGTEAGGINRAYHFYTPAPYDPTRAYALIFRFHGYGGSAISDGMEIEQDTAGGALIVAPGGLLEPNQIDQSWDPANEEADLALFDALLVWTADNYCVDLDRVDAYGFSAGGGFSQVLACRRGDALRAIGTIAAVNRTPGAPCQGKTAGYLSYDQNDPAVPLASGVATRDRLLLQDGCTTESMPVGTSCVRYTSCSPADPVVWCVTSRPAASAHDPGGAAAAKPIWQFFQGLPSTQ